MFPMPSNLHRDYGAGYLHFITTSCYQRRALLGAPQSRDLFLEVMEQVRRRYRFVVVGYVVMPEHVHLLFSEPERGDPSVVMKALKQAFARRLLEGIRALLTPEHRVSGRPPSSRVRSGNIASTISLCSRKRNAWRSSATRTAIRWYAVWYSGPNSGTGAAIATTLEESGDQCSSTNRRRQKCRCVESCD